MALSSWRQGLGASAARFRRIEALAQSSAVLSHSDERLSACSLMSAAAHSPLMSRLPRPDVAEMHRSPGPLCRDGLRYALARSAKEANEGPKN